MEFRETLLAAQRNQQHKSSESSYYKARFDPPKKEQKQRDKLSVNIQKFLAKKDEEEKQKKLEALKKRDELLAMRDPKLMNKIKKSLKVFKSANKSVIDDAYDRDNTAVTLNGPDQPDQDDYGYESQEAAAIYAKMMQKYSKLPDDPKFPTSNNSVKKDLNGTRERVKQALQHEDEPVPHKRRRRTNEEKSAYGRDESPPSKYDHEKEKRDEKEKQKSEKSKNRRPMPPPIDFNQLLKLAEQKKSEPLEVEKKKAEDKPKEGERLMTKRQKQEYEEEIARRQRRQERLDAEKAGVKKYQAQKEDKPVERDRKTEPSGFGRIPKLNNSSSDRNNSPKPSDRDKAEKLQREKDRARQERERIDKERNRLEKEKLDRDKTDRDKLDRLKAERERIERDIERLNKDRERLEKTKSKLENGRSDKFVDKKQNETVQKNIDLKSQNTYRIDKNSNDKKIVSKNTDRLTNGQSSHEKSVPKLNRDQQFKNGVKDKEAALKAKAYVDGKQDNSKRLQENKVNSKRPDDRMSGKPQAGPSKPKVSNSFDFDKHVSSLKKGGPDSANRNGPRNLPPGVKRKPQPEDRKKPNRRVVDSESEYDSEMDDFIDDGDVDMDYSKHIKEIFGYDKSRYRNVDDDDDPNMESSFARQQREEFLSKKIGIMEDLEDMRMEAMEKKKSSKKRRISDD